MPTPVNVAVVFYSATGTLTTMAKAMTEDAEAAGATVRLRKVAELAPQAAIDSNPAWAANIEATADIAEVTPDDMRWADAVVFGSPPATATSRLSSSSSWTPSAASGRRGNSPTRSTAASPPPPRPTAARRPL